MSLRVRQVNPAGTRTFMCVLTDGAMLHDALVELAAQHAIHTASFDLLGGLHRVELATYDFATRQRLSPVTYSGFLEVLAGHGTLALLDGKPAAHIHAVISHRDVGNPSATIIGGHVVSASAFALEITLHAYDGEPVTRALDHSSGLMLWNLPPVNNGG
jgi:uncharacterized protein